MKIALGPWMQKARDRGAGEKERIAHQAEPSVCLFHSSNTSLS